MTRYATSARGRSKYGRVAAAFYGVALPRGGARARAPEPRGLVSRTADAAPGYTLFAPFSDATTYLIDLDGNVVHTWSSRYRPGLHAYLLPDGRLLRGISVEVEVNGNVLAIVREV